MFDEDDMDDEDQFNNLNDTFSGLLNLPGEITTPFYCLHDLHDPSDIVEFFQLEGDLRNAFHRKYCSNVSLWDDMTNEELEEWIERLNEDFQLFPLTSYNKCMNN